MNLEVPRSLKVIGKFFLAIILSSTLSLLLSFFSVTITIMIQKHDQLLIWGMNTSCRVNLIESRKQVKFLLLTERTEFIV